MVFCFWCCGGEDGLPLLGRCMSGELLNQVEKDLSADWLCEQVSDVELGVQPSDVHDSELNGLLVQVICCVDILIARADEVFPAQPVCLSVVSEDDCWLLQDFRCCSDVFQELADPNQLLDDCGKSMYSLCSELSPRSLKVKHVILDGDRASAREA